MKEMQNNILLCYNFSMKIITKLLLIFSFFGIILPSYAIEEVLLDISGESSESHASVSKVAQKSLKEKIDEIKAKEVYDTSKKHYLLEDILTKKFEKSPIDTFHLFAYYRGNLQMNFYPTDNDLEYEYNSIDAGFNGKFKDGKSFYEAKFRFAPQDRYTFLQYMPSNLYIGTRAIPNHTIVFGNVRTPNGYEGSTSSELLPFVARSQISRTFGNTRKLGMRIRGNYSLLEYDLGGFSSDTYFRKFMPGAEFASLMSLKPLGKTNGKYGTLKIGGGITAGENNSSYLVSTAYASYDYKKFFANFEYANADGYNGSRGISRNKAEGFYTTVGYKVTPKLQILGRYDQFTPNKNNSSDIRREYSAGVNYFLKGQALKLMLNYVFCQNDCFKDSHRIVIGTQIVL